MITLSKEIHNCVTGRKEIRTRLIDTHELAWAAGFFEGEGTFGTIIPITRNGSIINPLLRVSIPQKDKLPLRRFKKAVLNLGIIYRRNETAWGPIYVYQSQTFRESQAIAALLWKYFTPDSLKRDQYIEAAKKYHTNYLGEFTKGRYPELIKSKIGGKELTSTLQSSTENAVIIDVDSLTKGIGK